VEFEQGWSSGYDGHRAEQIRRVARETTPEQRVHWLEDTLLLLWENGLLPSKLPDSQEPKHPS
jgi:hypothetical protein